MTHANLERIKVNNETGGGGCSWGNGKAEISDLHIHDSLLNCTVSQL